MMYSWFAQASKLSLSSYQNPRGIDCRVHNMKYIELCQRMYFNLHITPCYDPFQLLETFMADSEHVSALSLTVCEPRLDSRSKKICRSVLHWFSDLNLSKEISVEEAEALFGIEVELGAHEGLSFVPRKTFSTIIEINTICGFDPVLEGADICEYVDLPCMEIFENPAKLYHRRRGYKIDTHCRHLFMITEPLQMLQTLPQSLMYEQRKNHHPLPCKSGSSQSSLRRTLFFYHWLYVLLPTYRGVEQTGYVWIEPIATLYYDPPKSCTIQICASKFVIPLSASLQMLARLQEPTYSQSLAVIGKALPLTKRHMEHT